MYNEGELVESCRAEGHPGERTLEVYRSTLPPRPSVTMTPVEGRLNAANCEYDQSLLSSLRWPAPICRVSGGGLTQGHVGSDPLYSSLRRHTDGHHDTVYHSLTDKSAKSIVQSLVYVGRATRGNISIRGSYFIRFLHGSRHVYG